jgi:hypothetical protein
MKPGYNYSGTSSLGVQTGYRAGVIAVEHDFNDATLRCNTWSYYRFDDKLFPQAMSNVSKKVSYTIMYGGALSIDGTLTGKLQDLPTKIWGEIYNALTLPQKRKVCGGLEWLI